MILYREALDRLCVRLNMYLVSKISFMQIFAGFRGKVHQTTLGWSKTATFRSVITSEPVETRPKDLLRFITSCVKLIFRADMFSAFTFYVTMQLHWVSEPHRVNFNEDRHVVCDDHSLCGSNKLLYKRCVLNRKKAIFDPP